MSIDLGLQILNISIAFLFVSVGLRTKFADTLLLFRNRSLGLRALLAMYVFVPCCTLLMIWIFPLEPVIRASLLAMSVAPLCPVLCKAATEPETEGDYLFALQLFAAVAAIVALPIVLVVAEHTFNFTTKYPLVAVVWVILRQIVIPLVFGMVIVGLLGRWREKAALWLDRIGNFLLAVGMVLVLYHVLPNVWGFMVNGRLLYVAAFTAIVIVGGYVFGGSQRGVRHNLIMASVQRHPGITYLIATTILPAEEAAILAVVAMFAIVGTVATVPYLFQSSKEEA